MVGERGRHVSGALGEINDTAARERQRDLGREAHQHGRLLAMGPGPVPIGVHQRPGGQRGAVDRETRGRDEMGQKIVW
jgi:hypothetical protein